MAAGSPTDAAWLVAAAEPAGVRSGGNDAGPFGNVDRILDPRLRQERPFTNSLVDEGTPVGTPCERDTPSLHDANGHMRLSRLSWNLRSPARNLP